MLHLFDRSCNLISSDGDLISLVTQEIGDGPFNLVLPPIRFTGKVSVDAKVMCQNGWLRVGHLEIDTSQALVWDPRPEWDRLRQGVREIRARIPLLTTALITAAPVGGLAEQAVSRNDSTPQGENYTLRPARASVDKLLEGLRRCDRILYEEAALELAGCGVGLTPEGDDFLLGCLLAVRVLYDEEKADEIAGGIAEAAARHTTDLSAEWLRYAAKGECAWPWHTMVNNLLEGREEKIKVAAEAILQQGHTSGSAALAGFAVSIQIIS